MKIGSWKSNNAGENKAKIEIFYWKKEFGIKFELTRFGIKLELTARKTPQQDGRIERAFATLYGRMRAMFANAGFEQVKRNTLWATFTAPATKLDNILIRTSDQKSPCEKLYSKTN